MRAAARSGAAVIVIFAFVFIFIIVIFFFLIVFLFVARFDVACMDAFFFALVVIILIVVFFIRRLVFMLHVVHFITGGAFTGIPGEAGVHGGSEPGFFVFFHNMFFLVIHRTGKIPMRKILFKINASG